MKQRHSFDPIGRTKGFLKNWLLPHPFKIVGQVMLLVMLLATVAHILIGNQMVTGDVTPEMVKLTIINKIAIITLYLGMFLITCSREKNEDEMTAALRGETLKEIGYLVMLIYVVYRIAATIITDNALYITRDESLLTPFIIWILYYGRFERKMRNMRRQSREFKL